MTQPVRLQLSRRKGFDLQAWSRETNGLTAINVSRPRLLGNPFVVGQPSGWKFKDGGDPTPIIAALSAEQAIAFYREAISGHLMPEMHPGGHEWVARWRRRFGGILPSRELERLQGCNLACWCSLEARWCHADVLLELAAGAANNRRLST